MHLFTDMDFRGWCVVSRSLCAISMVPLDNQNHVLQTALAIRPEPEVMTCIELGDGLQ